MISRPTLNAVLVAAFIALTGTGSPPVLSAEPDPGVEQPPEPAVTDLIRRILDDPDRDYSTVDSAYDCNTEALYLATRDVLGKYVSSPNEQQAYLSEYILSGKEQCHCTQAIVGKHFDTLLGILGPETSGYRSCDGMRW